MIRSFEGFGGVPEEGLVDTQKATDIAHRRRGEVTFHPRLLDLAGQDGFTPRACRPARAQTTGKDERNIGDVKQHVFVRSRRVERWAHLNPLAEPWLREGADQRVHGTLGEVVTARFAREAPHLRPLPPQRYDTAYWELRRVSWDASGEVRGDRDSVPADWAGQLVRVRITLDGQLSVYAGEACLAQHALRPAPQGWVTVPAHHAALWLRTLDVEPRLLAVSEEAATWN